jgi:hypothetical protein
VFPAAPAEAGGASLCLRCAVRHPSIVGRATRVALIVGTILTAINQGNVILSGHLVPELLWKIPLTFLVPYSVSTYSALGAVRQTQALPRPAGPAEASEARAHGSD